MEKSQQTLGDVAYLTIEKHCQKIFKHEAGVLRDSDPEELHQMRVGMRRLRSTISTFALAIILPVECQEKAISKVSKILGNLRDLDVLEISLTNEYQPHLPKAEQKYLDRVIKFLERQRPDKFKQVKKTLEGKIYQRSKEALQQWLKTPDYQEFAHVNLTDILPDLLLGKLSTFFLHSGWLISASPVLPSQIKTIHNLRKETKRLRYCLEMFTHCYDDRYGEYMEKIKDIQTILGELQDNFVLIDFLHQVLDLELYQITPILSKQLTESIEKKWQEWTIIKNEFLAVTCKQDFYTTLQQPII